MNKRSRRAIVILVLITSILCCLYIAVRMYEVKSYRRFPWQNYLATHRRNPVSSADISYIAPWMTFDYVNKVFNLPSTSLQESLQIKDKKYPFITIGQYAKTIGTSTGALIGGVQDILKKYLASSTPQ